MISGQRFRRLLGAARLDSVLAAASLLYALATTSAWCEAAPDSARREPRIVGIGSIDSAGSARLGSEGEFDLILPTGAWSLARVEGPPEEVDGEIPFIVTRTSGSLSLLIVRLAARADGEVPRLDSLARDKVVTLVGESAAGSAAVSTATIGGVEGRRVRHTRDEPDGRWLVTDDFLLIGGRAFRLTHEFLEREAAAMMPAAAALLAGFRVASGARPGSFSADSQSSFIRDGGPSEGRSEGARRPLGARGKERLWRRIVQEHQAGLTRRKAAPLEGPQPLSPEARALELQRDAERFEARNDWAAAQLRWNQALDAVIRLGPNRHDQALVLLSRLLAAAERANGEGERRALEKKYERLVGRRDPEGPAGRK